MASTLSNRVNNIFEVIHEVKCKYGHDDQKYENSGIKLNNYDNFLEYTNFEDDLIKHKRLCCNKNYKKKMFDENLKEQSFNTYKFSNHDINKFILLFQKCVYTYKYMDDWEKFTETSLPKKIYLQTWKILRTKFWPCEKNF